MTPGTIITRTAPAITQAQIDRWGELAGTRAAIHSDPEFAARTPLGGVIAQGMLVLAPLHNVMLELVGARAWYEGGSISAKLVNVTRPGEAVTYEVEVQAGDGPGFHGAFRCRRDDGTLLIVGTVHTRAPPQE